MKDKIVVLNSGGFDSIVLMNCLHYLQEEENIYSLHFLYGERNEKQQLECVNKVCEKIGVKENKIIKLPNFDWTSSDFYKQGYDSLESQYLEYRNLIFLSYAVSYAQSIGAKEIYCAFLKGHYADTNENFIGHFNDLIKESGISLKTPFSDFEYKYNLIPYCTELGIKVDDYFSCDNPTKEGNPCGECYDCLELKEINKILRVDHHFKAFIQYGLDNPLFVELQKQEKIKEIRALINNDCQLNCEHCFYGFSNMISSPVSKEDYFLALKEGVEKLGVENIHFSGKEPLFDDTILWYAEKIQKELPECTFNIVTNGINVPKYAKQLKKFGVERIFLSADVSGGIRNTSSVINRALDSCQENNIPVEIFIDLHKGNYNRVGELCEYFIHYTSVIDSFYVRNIRSIGNAINFNQLDGTQFNEAFEQLKDLAKKYPKIRFTINLSKECENIIDGNLRDTIYILDKFYTSSLSENLFVFLESYCNRFGDTITLTPDGFVLGCASDVAIPSYNLVSAGNIRHNSLEKLVKKGKEQLEYCNNCYLEGFDKCYINSLEL